MTATAAGRSRLCRARLSVFPCWPASKEPACRHGFNNATSNPATIRRWWLAQPDYNIAIATGLRSRVWMFDVDGATGAETLRDLEARHGAIPSTLTLDHERRVPSVVPMRRSDPIERRPRRPWPRCSRRRRLCHGAPIDSSRWPGLSLDQHCGAGWDRARLARRSDAAQATDIIDQSASNCAAHLSGCRVPTPEPRSSTRSRNWQAPRTANEIMRSTAQAFPCINWLPAVNSTVPKSDSG